MSVVDDVKSRLDIVNYIQRYVPLKRSGRTYKACCPFHTERTPSFHVNPDRGTWRCFGACATGGNIFDFAMRYHGWTFREALTELAKEAGVDVRPESPEQKAQSQHLDRLRGVVAAAVDFYHQRLFDPRDPAAVEALNYVRHKRGLTDETLHAFEIGYAPNDWQQLTHYLTNLGYNDDDVLSVNVSTRSQKSNRLFDTFRNRLMIPIKDERGRTVGFGGRALDPNEKAKYINSAQTPIFDKSKLLFALDHAAKSMRDTDTAVIVEGYLDAIQAHQAGYTNVVAQMGTALTEAQLKLIAPRRAHRIIMALDGDSAGQSATRRSLAVARDVLEAYNTGKLTVDIFVLMMTGAKDPDDLIRENPAEWEKLLNHPTPLAQYVIDTAAGQLPANPSLTQRQELAMSLIPLLMPTEKGQQSKDNIQRLALKLKLQEADIFVLESRVRQQQRQQQNAARPAARTTPDHPTGNGHDPAQNAVPDFSSEPPPLDIDYPPGLEDGWDTDLTDLPGMLAEVGYGSVGRWEVGIEKDCLRRLLHEPTLYYHINRKLREVGQVVPEGVGGWLNEFSPDDFRSDTYSALMRAFEEAIAQDEYPTLEYMQQQLDMTLNHELNHLLLTEWDEFEPRLRYVKADLRPTVTWVERMRLPRSAANVVVGLAFYMREQRLRREEESLRFLLREAQEDEAEINPTFMLQLRRIQQLRRRLQVELRQQKML